jgi:hypothetical protein
MLWEGKEQGIQAIAEARRVRDALLGADGDDLAKMLPLVLRSLGQMIDVSESLICEQEKYESRLHRTHSSPAAVSLHTSAPQ